MLSLLPLADSKLRFLCGADLLESFATPGLWAEQDVRHVELVMLIEVEGGGREVGEREKRREGLREGRLSIGKRGKLHFFFCRYWR